MWWLAGPYDMDRTNSVSLTQGQTTGTIQFVSPRKLLQLDIDNGGTMPTTITMACAGQPIRSVVVQPHQVVQLKTNWTGVCSTVQIGSSNGWDTNFDNIVIQ